MLRLTRLLISFALLWAALPGLAATPAPRPTGGNPDPYWIGPAISGSWFNSARSGEGFILELLNDGSALAVWFTYAPAGNNGAQAWIIAQDGRVDGDRIVFQNALTTRGPRFGAGYNPADIQVLPWGTLEFRFESCDRGSLSYSGPAQWGSGTQSLTRLTRVRGLDCQNPPLTDTNGMRPLTELRSTSGAWFDPGHAGEGWFVEELSATASLVYWFSYDSSGEQAWFLGVGQRQDPVLDIALAQPVGASFGADFNPNDVRALAWGSLRFAYDDCLQADATYASTLPGFGNGQMNARRLSLLASSPCLVEEPQLAVLGHWRQGTRMPIAQSEVATAQLGDHTYVAGGFNAYASFQRYDRVADSWLRLADMPGGRHHALSATFGGAIYVFGGYPAGGGDASSSAWRYEVSTNQWSTVPGVPAVVASGAAVLNGRVYLGDESGAVVEYDPRSGRHRYLPLPGIVSRDHSQLVAWLGEIWLIGGRAFQTLEQPLVSVYSPTSDTWRSGPSLNTPRAGFAAAVVDEQIMVVGGEWIFGNLRVLDDFEVLAPGASRWAPGPRLPVALHGVGGVNCQGQFCVMGGSSRAGGTGNAGEVQIYVP